MTKVAVTGACGFVGPSVVNLGLKLGHEVFATDVGAQYKKFLDPKASFTPGVDIRNPEAVAKWMQSVDPEIVLHVAAYFKYHGPWKLYEEINIDGTRNVLEASLQCKRVKRVVVWSSGSVLGNRFKGQGWLDETVPPEPRSFYEESKWQAEKLALSYNDRVPVTIIRPAAIYGSGVEFGGPAGSYGALKVIQMLFKNQLQAVPGNGKNKISFIHVEDIARIAYFLAETEAAAGQVYNTADRSNYTLGELIGHIAHWIKSHNIPIDFYPKLHFSLPLVYSLGLWCEGLAKIQKREPAVERPFLNFFRKDYHFLMSNEKLDRCIQQTEGKRTALLGPVIKYRDIIKDGGLGYNLDWYRRHLLCC